MIEIKSLTKCYGRSKIPAVKDFTLTINRRETLGLVGESGSGKSTVGKCLLQLETLTSGSITYDGQDIREIPRRLFRRKVQIIFQDPYASLSPRMTIGEIIREPFIIHKVGTKSEQLLRVAELLKLVGLDDGFTKRYPHELSGGQRQRVGIARAIALEPEMLVCDEAISALDVSVQAQIINLLQDLQQKFGLTLLFIAHDLRVVRHISDRIAVMHRGRLVELAESDALFESPQADYTKSLLASIPKVNA